MKKKWNSPKAIIGSPAKGQYFYPRDEIVEEVWTELAKGNHILIAAPRRVGKTSVLKFMETDPREGYHLAFKNIQSLASSEDFFKTLFLMILECLDKTQKTKRWLSNYLKTKKITEFSLSAGSVKLAHGELIYLDELNKLIPALKKHEETIVLLLDELPDVLYNLHKKKKNEDAIQILKSLRTWRQEDQYQKLKFVLTGSVGIHYVVQQIEGRLADLNDLREVACRRLSKEEAASYIQWATREASVIYNEETLSYLIDEIKYTVPYFLNLMLDGIDKAAKRKGRSSIDKEDIDQAFDIVQNNNSHFEDWRSRLSKYLSKNDFLFVNNILIHIAHEDSITLQEIYNKAVKHRKESDYMTFIGDLEKDGYITKVENKYVFISPFLKAFWKNNNPVYHG